MRCSKGIQTSRPQLTGRCVAAKTCKSIFPALYRRDKQGGPPMPRTPRRWKTLFGVVSGLTLLAAGNVSAQTPAAEALRQRPPQDEVIYFLLPDRFANGDAANDHGGYAADRLVSGFDPSSPEFYHGGDLAGVIERLDYIQGLGVTAIWMAPIFKNKPVQADGRPAHGGLPRLLDHRLHPPGPAFRRAGDDEGPRRRRPCARHEGLSGHRHQPHRRRDPVSRMPGQRLRLSFGRGLSPHPARRRGRGG